MVVCVLFSPEVATTLREEGFKVIELDVFPLYRINQIICMMPEMMTETEYRLIFKQFMKYVDYFKPSRWFVFFPGWVSKLRKCGVSLDYPRFSIDTCRFKYPFRKRYKIISNFDFPTKICWVNCVYKESMFHEMEEWLKPELTDIQKENVKLYKKLDQKYPLPPSFLRKILEYE